MSVPSVIIQVILGTPIPVKRRVRHDMNQHTSDVAHMLTMVLVYLATELGD